MTSATVKTDVKAMLGLTGSTFDALLDTLIPIAVNRLFPDSGYELPRVSVNVSVDNYGEAIIDLSAQSPVIAFARRVEYLGSGTAAAEVEDKYHQGRFLYLRQLPSWTTSVLIYGIAEFTLHATVDASTTIPNYLQLGLYWYIMSAFYDQLAGSKSDYNIYSQTSGARMVDNLRDESTYFEAKAKQYVMEQTNIYTS